MKQNKQSKDQELGIKTFARNLNCWNKSDFKIFKNSRTLSNVTDKLLKKTNGGK